MAEITAKLIQELRQKTGISISKCKEALVTADGNLETAVENLRKAGLASAVKKEGRETKEGLVVVGEGASHFAVVEVNAETDFVVNNDIFKDFAKAVAKAAAEAKPASVEAFMAQPAPHDKSITVDDYRALTIQSLGENIQIRRLELLEKTPTTSVGTYSHMGGKLLVVVELEGANDQADLARDIAMHAAAEAPEYVNTDEIPADIVARERDIAKEQVKGKPENIIDKIIEGKIGAFYDQTCLTRQKFIKNPDLSISELVANRGKEIGKDLKVKRFVRWAVGART